MKKRSLLGILIVLVGLSSLVPAAYTADYYCEVMTLKGTATAMDGTGISRELKQGDLLKQGDKILVGSESYLDVAYDKDWNNITRFNAGTSVNINSVFPTGIYLKKGDLFAKLTKLPKNSTFEVQTPTAVAAVRGTEFFATVDAVGKTEIIGIVHEVEVFNLDARGGLGERVLVGESEKIEVGVLNEAPRVPEKVTEEDVAKIRAMGSEIEAVRKENIDSGRFAHVQDVQSVEVIIRFEKAVRDAKEDSPDKKEGDTSNLPENSDDNKTGTGGGCPPDCGNDGDPGDGADGSVGGAGLNPDQMDRAKDEFLRNGGSQEMMSSFLDTMKGASPERFDTTMNHFREPDNFNPPGPREPGPNLGPPSAGTMPFNEPEHHLPFVSPGGEFVPHAVHPPPTFVPPCPPAGTTGCVGSACPPLPPGC